MKKSLVVAVIAMMVLSGASFAASAKKSTKAGVQFGFGYDSFGATPTNIGIIPQTSAAIKIAGDSFDVSAGLAIASSAGSTAFGLGGKVTMALGSGSNVMNAGASMSLMTAGGSSVFSISPVIGASTTISNDINIGFDIYPVSVMMASGTTSFSALSGGLYAFYMF